METVKALKNLDQYVRRYASNNRTIIESLNSVVKALKMDDELKKEQIPSIRQWMRDSENQIIGVMISFRTESGVCIGWSKKNSSDPKPFNKDFGLMIATNRAMTGSSIELKRHGNTSAYELKEQYKLFIKRSFRYFKDSPIATIAGNFKMLEELRDLLQTRPAGF